MHNSPKFKMLQSPIGKVMLNKATISDMSEKSGMSTENIIAGLRELIEVQEKWEQKRKVS